MDSRMIVDHPWFECIISLAIPSMVWVHHIFGHPCDLSINGYSHGSWHELGADIPRWTPWCWEWKVKCPWTIVILPGPSALFALVLMKSYEKRGSVMKAGLELSIIISGGSSSSTLWVGKVALSTHFTVVTPKDSQPRTAEICFLIIFTFVACLTFVHSDGKRLQQSKCIRFASRTKCDKKRGMIIIRTVVAYTVRFLSSRMAMG